MNMATLKLLINPETNEVIFAEAGKKSVDIIFGIMALPMATAVRMVRDLGMGGSLGNVLQSIENLDDNHVHPGQNKKALLQPTRASTPINHLLLFDYDGDDEPDEDYNCVEEDGVDDGNENDDDDDDYDDEKESHYDDEVEEDGSTEPLFVKCPECTNSGYAVDKRAICPKCSRHMMSCMQFVPSGLVGSGPGELGWVNGVTTYMVMDDLVVKPISAILTLTMLKEFNIKDASLLQEKEVFLGLKEALMLLNASFHSKKVLTEVFINNQPLQGHRTSCSS